MLLVHHEFVGSQKPSEVDKYHAVVASHESEMRQIQARESLCWEIWSKIGTVLGFGVLV